MREVCAVEDEISTTTLARIWRMMPTLLCSALNFCRLLLLERYGLSVVLGFRAYW